MNRIINKIIGIVIYGLGMLLVFDIVTIEELGDPTPLIFVLLGSLMIEVNTKK